MKIGIVCYPTFGGSGVVATELGIALSSRGHEVHFISYSQPFRLDAFSSNLFFHEVPVAHYPLFEFLPYEISLTSKLVDVCIHHQLDLLHVHYAIPHASAAYMAKQILKSKGLNVPFVTTLHGTDITLIGRDPSYLPVIEFSINESDAVTTVSENLKQDTLKYFDVNRSIEVIYNFIDTKKYNHKPQGCEKKEYAPNGEKLLIHISNFRPVKRLNDLMNIFKQIHGEIPSRLLLVGDGPDRVSVENLARQLGVIHDVLFLGKIKNVEQILQISDLFLLTSENESFGLSALEALASGVPVVSTNTGGVAEVNRDGYSGFLSPVGDIDAMAKNALTLLTDEKMLAEFSKNARQQALRFDVNQILPAYEAIYRKILS